MIFLSFHGFDLVITEVNIVMLKWFWDNFVRTYDNPSPQYTNPFACLIFLGGKTFKIRGTGLVTYRPLQQPRTSKQDGKLAFALAAALWAAMAA